MISAKKESRMMTEREAYLEKVVIAQARRITNLVSENNGLRILYKAHERKIEELSVERDSLKVLSDTDPLTGLGNKRAFDRELQQSVGIALRSHTPISLVFFDVVGLKRINDTIGAWAGDKLIQAAAKAINRQRSTDAFFRSSEAGDEFYSILPLADNTGVKGYIKSVRMAAEAESAILKEHLLANKHARDAIDSGKFKTGKHILSLYIGFATYVPKSYVIGDTNFVVSDLLVGAQRMLNEKKQNSRTSRDSKLLLRE